jgi:pyruvate,water dikinase
MFTKTFQQLSRKDTAIAGGKGASLGEMTQAGIPIPPGFVILASAFEKFLEETNLRPAIDAELKQVNYEDINSVDRASNVIHGLIRSVETPIDLQAEILRDFSSLKFEFVAVRSSATAEDSAVASWAGELESYLNTDINNLLENVKNCWISLFTARAIFYRKEKKFLDSQIGVAVAVQKMIQAEVSGICFSVHPVTEDSTQILIEAGWGLGEAIVGGLITPDSYVVQKSKKEKKQENIANFLMLDKSISKQEIMIVRDKNGTKEIMVPEMLQKNQKLSDEQVFELAEICQKIEDHYGFPCDIEWAFENGKFFILQSRPITTLRQNQ